MRAGRGILITVACILAAGSAPALSAPAKTAASGKTQVVARVAGREITLSELRVEMARLGLSPADLAAERTAMASLLNRALLAKAARSQNLHKKADAIQRVAAAEEQALADFYLAVASQPAEPTREEIEDYVRANPSLFGERRAYEFMALTLPSKAFDEKSMTALFDEDSDFSRLSAELDRKTVVYSITPVAQSGAAFPEPVRVQLSRYGVRDNIVLRGEAETQILKIIRVKSDAPPQAEWGPLARRVLMETAARRRAEDLMARLRKESEIAYYRPSAAPPPAPKKP